jgi:hypothetical protein
VIDPPPYERTWNAGRAYPLMRPSVTVIEILPAAEAARWLSKVKQPVTLMRKGNSVHQLAHNQLIRAPSAMPAD